MILFLFWKTNKNSGCRNTDRSFTTRTVIISLRTFSTILTNTTPTMVPKNAKTHRLTWRTCMLNTMREHRKFFWVRRGIIYKTSVQTDVPLLDTDHRSRKRTGSRLVSIESCFFQHTIYMSAKNTWTVLWFWMVNLCMHTHHTKNGRCTVRRRWSVCERDVRSFGVYRWQIVISNLEIYHNHGG